MRTPPGSSRSATCGRSPPRSSSGCSIRGSRRRREPLPASRVERDHDLRDATHGVAQLYGRVLGIPLAGARGRERWRPRNEDRLPDPRPHGARAAGPARRAPGRAATSASTSTSTALTDDETFEAMRAGLDGREQRRLAARASPATGAASASWRRRSSGSRAILASGDLPDHALLLSGQDYPLRSPGEIERYLAARRGRNFLHHFHSARRGVGRRGRRAQPSPLPVLRADSLQDAAAAPADPPPPSARARAVRRDGALGADRPDTGVS